MLPLMQPVPVAEVPRGTVLRIIGAAGAGFPSPAQDWEDDAISLIELLRLDRAASFVFRISGSSMVDAGIYDNDVVVVDRDTRPAEGHIVIAIVDGGFVCRQLCRRRGAAVLEARNAQQIYEPTPAEGGPVRECSETYAKHDDGDLMPFDRAADTAEVAGCEIAWRDPEATLSCVAE